MLTLPTALAAKLIILLLQMTSWKFALTDAEKQKHLAQSINECQMHQTRFALSNCFSRVEILSPFKLGEANCSYLPF